MSDFLFRLITTLFLAGFIAVGNAQENHPIIFIYDASGSMWGKIGTESKMQIASRVLSSSLSGLPSEQELSLVAYGHREKEDCEDVEFLINKTTDKNEFSRKLEGIKPLGRTPLAFSALEVIGFLKKEKSKATIILITDGVESCGGDLCDVIEKAKQEGVPFKLHVVGFGLKQGETDALQCAAHAGGGKYFDAADSEGLESVLWEATQNTVDEPLQNVSFTVSKNNSLIDAFIRAFDQKTNTATGAVRTYRDTGFLYLPSGTHRLEIRALENSDLAIQEIEGLVIGESGPVHRDFSFDSGKITLLTTNNDQPLDARIRVFSRNSKKAIAAGRTYGEPEIFDLDPGSYDFEIEAIGLEGANVRQWIKGKEINAGSNEQVSFPFESGTLKIGVESNGTLVDALVKIKDVKTGNYVVTKRTYTSSSSNPRVFHLLPGKYQIEIKGLKEFGEKQATKSVQIGREQTIEHIEKF